MNFEMNEGYHGTGFLLLDFDRDGDLDPLVIFNRREPILYQNNTGQENQWLQIRAEGSRSNRDGIGALVRIYPTASSPALLRYVDGGSNFLSHNERLVHVGLGVENLETVDRIEVTWPSGIVQTLRDVAPNQELLIQEPKWIPVELSDFKLNRQEKTVELYWEGNEDDAVLVQVSNDLRSWRVLDHVTAVEGLNVWTSRLREEAVAAYYRLFR